MSNDGHHNMKGKAMSRITVTEVVRKGRVRFAVVHADGKSRLYASPTYARRVVLAELRSAELSALDTELDTAETLALVLTGCAS